MFGLLVWKVKVAARPRCHWQGAGTHAAVMVVPPPPPPQFDLHGVAVGASGGVAVGVGEGCGVCELLIGLLPGVAPPFQSCTVGV